MSTAPVYVDNESALAVLCRDLQKETIIAVDTEFVWTKTYFPLLGIIQIASRDSAHIIDVPAINDFEPLKQLMENPEITKVFHDAFQDISIINHFINCRIVSVFDTQLGAAMAGEGGALSLEKLLKRLVNVALPKTETRTDWMKRPLAEAQIEYALDDVKFLVKSAEILMDKAREQGNIEWLLIENKKYDKVEPFVLEDSIERQFLRHANRIQARFRDKLYRIVYCLEECSRMGNVPRDYILRKDKVTALASVSVRSKDELVQRKFMVKKIVNRYGDIFMEALSGDLPCPEDIFKKMRRPSSDTPETTALIAIFSSLVFSISRAHSIEPAIVASKSDCADKIREHVETGAMPFFGDWRGELLNKDIERFFTGELQLTYSREDRTIVPVYQ